MVGVLTWETHAWYWRQCIIVRKTLHNMSWSTHLKLGLYQYQTLQGLESVFLCFSSKVQTWSPVQITAANYNNVGTQGELVKPTIVCSLFPHSFSSHPPWMTGQPTVNITPAIYSPLITHPHHRLMAHRNWDTTDTFIPIGSVERLQVLAAFWQSLLVVFYHFFSLGPLRVGLGGLDYVG